MQKQYIVMQKQYILLQKQYVLLQKQYVLLQKQYVLLQKQYVCNITFVLEITEEAIIKVISLKTHLDVITTCFLSKM